MNIVVFTLVVLVLALLVFGFLKYLIFTFINTGNKTINLIWSLICLILFVIAGYSSLVYVGKIDDPIEQGVLRESVIKSEVGNVKVIVPTIKTKYPTDEEIYERQIKRFDK